MKQLISRIILCYLRLLAKIQLFKVKPLIVGITGSAGKTSLRNAVEAILKDKYSVKVSYKANSETGIPLNILDLGGKGAYRYLDWLWILPSAWWKLLTNWQKYQIYIVEMGVDSPLPPKNMEYLLTIVRPQIGVFLNALPVHCQPYDHLVPKEIKSAIERKNKVIDLITLEKGKLITGLPATGVAIINADDKRVNELRNKTKAKIISFGMEKGDIRVEQITSSIKGFSMQVLAEKTKFHLELPRILADKNIAITFSAALAVAKALNIPLQEAIKSLEKNFKMPPSRMSIIPGIKNTLILDSSYNASRVPMISALQTLNRIANNKRIAVLGDMREMGEEAKAEHQLVAREAVKNCDVLVMVGPLMKSYLLPEVKRLGFPQENCYIFDNTYQAVKALKNRIIKGKETILIKASQNNLFFEIIVEALMKYPEEAEQLLCRRGRFWDQKRQQLRKR